MIMRTVALPQITDCRSYLLEAERAVDALSDEELDEFEKQLEASIQKLVQKAPPATLKLVTETPAVTHKPQIKSKKNNVIWPAFSGLLVAAIALFFVQVQKQSNTVPQWETKGTSSSSASACQVSLHEQNVGSPDRTDHGFLVNKSAKVFLKTNCAQKLTVQTKVAGQWQAPVALSIESEDLDGKDNYFDLSSFVGKEVRIQSADGLNEEFELEIKR